VNSRKRGSHVPLNLFRNLHHQYAIAPETEPYSSLQYRERQKMLKGRKEELHDQKSIAVFKHLPSPPRSVLQGNR
jgi:hypothetical protein